MAERIETAPRTGGGGDERGVSTLEFVMIAPALIALIFGIVQFSLWYYAGEVARAAATAAAQAGAAGAGSAAAQTRAAAVLDGPGNGIVHGGQVHVDAQGANMTVTVSGHAVSLVFGVTLDVNATASEPLEQFSPQGRR